MGVLLHRDAGVFWESAEELRSGMNKPLCKYCGKQVTQSWGSINRATKDGKPVYCDKNCAGLARRKGKTPEQKKAEKRQYDIEYRERNKDSRKAQKAEYHRLTYDPLKAAIKRKERMPYHIQYCRRPEYKAWKRRYDQQYRARKQYGEFAEAVIVLREVEKEVMERVDRSEIYATNGTLNKKQTRRKEYERLNSN